jgi:hypothetical protein
MTNMSSFTIRAPKDLISQAKAKAGYIPLSVILRKLIEKWVNGEIELDLNKKV